MFGSIIVVGLLQALAVLRQPMQPFVGPLDLEPLSRLLMVRTLLVRHPVPRHVRVLPLLRRKRHHPGRLLPPLPLLVPPLPVLPRRGQRPVGRPFAEPAVPRPERPRVAGARAPLLPLRPLPLVLLPQLLPDAVPLLRDCLPHQADAPAPPLPAAWVRPEQPLLRCPLRLDLTLVFPARAFRRLPTARPLAQHLLLALPRPLQRPQLLLVLPSRLLHLLLVLTVLPRAVERLPELRRLVVVRLLLLVLTRPPHP